MVPRRYTFTCRSARRSPTTDAASHARPTLLRPDPIALPGLQHRPSVVSLASNPALRAMKASGVDRTAVGKMAKGQQRLVTASEAPSFHDKIAIRQRSVGFHRQPWAQGIDRVLVALRHHTGKDVGNGRPWIRTQVHGQHDGVSGFKIGNDILPRLPRREHKAVVTRTAGVSVVAVPAAQFLIPVAAVQGVVATDPRHLAFDRCFGFLNLCKVALRPGPRRPGHRQSLWPLPEQGAACQTGWAPPQDAVAADSRGCREAAGIARRTGRLVTDGYSKPPSALRHGSRDQSPPDVQEDRYNLDYAGCGGPLSGRNPMKTSWMRNAVGVFCQGLIYT